MDGIIPLYKERGMTSFDCVAKMRHILHTKKIGHSGTLDPNVDGVLPICVGSATKVVDYLMASGKQYTGSITLGFATTTEDLDGEVVEETPLNQPFSLERLQEALASLTGEIIQIPPMYSAVKVNGRRLYEYARAGETVERPERHATITRFEIVGDPIFDAAKGTQTFKFVVDCGKGTYVRTLAVDAGKFLGVASVMSDLTRQKSGGFTLDQTHSLAEIEQAMIQETIDELLYPIDVALSEYPVVDINERLFKLVQNGVFLFADQLKTEAPEVTLRYQGQIKALYQRTEDGRYRPLKMFSLDA